MSATDLIAVIRRVEINVDHLYTPIRHKIYALSIYLCPRFPHKTTKAAASESQ